MSGMMSVRKPAQSGNAALSRTVPNAGRTTPPSTPLSALRGRGLVGETVWLGLGRALAALGAIASIRILTDVLPPAAYGDLMLGMSGAMLAQALLFSPISTTLQRFYSASLENDTGGGYWRAAVHAIKWTTGLVILAGLVLASVLAATDHLAWAPLIVAATLFAVCSGFGGIFDSVQNAARNRRLVAIHQVLEQWLRIGMAVGLMALAGASGWAGMAGFAAAAGLLAISRWWFFQPQRQLLQAQAGSIPESRDEMAAYAWPFICWGFFFWATHACDRWTLRLFSDAAEVGYYAVLFQLGVYPLQLLTDLIQQLLGPIFFSRAGDGRDRQRMQSVFRLQWQILAVTFPLVVVATATAWLLSDWVLYVFAAPAYRGCAPLLPVMTLAGGLAAATQVACLALISGRNVRPLLPVRVGGSVVICLLCGIGGAWMGMTGIVWALMGGQAVMCGCTLWLLRSEGGRLAAPQPLAESPLAQAA